MNRDFTVVEMKISIEGTDWEDTPVVNIFKFQDHATAEAFIKSFPLYSQKGVRFNFLGSTQGHYRGGWDWLAGGGF